MFLSGLCGLSYEVLWTRVLVFVTTNSTYAFSIMLITFLAGLALGSLLATRFVDRLKKLSAVLGAVLIAAGGGALLTALLLSLIPAIHDRLFMATPATTWWAWNGIRFLECFLVMVLPTIFLGMSFPLASRLVISGLEGTGTRLGLLSFFNTAGGALGSFLAGAVMVPLLGTAVSLILFFVVHIWVGLSLVFSSSSRWRRPILVLPMFAVFLVFISQGAIREKGFRSAFVHVEKDFQLLDAREGLEGTVTVHRSERLIEPVTRLDVDGLNVAGTSFLLNTLQILQAHIPLSLCSDAKNVLQIGFGTGQTTASAILHPIARMDLVEISGDVMALSRRHFDHINGRVWTDPRVAVHIGDGKNALKYADRRYDVIMNDANYAVATASASLFTEDHFQNGRKALRSRGFFSTWMTIDLDPADFAVVLATFRSVFPYCTLWMAPNTVNKQVVLIGSADPWDIDLAVLSERFSDPKIKNDLASVNIGSVYDFLDALVLDSEGIRDIAKTAPINRDDRPILEFSRKDIRSRDFCSLQNLGRILARRPDISRMLSGLPRTLEERRIKDDLLRHHRIASRKLFEGMLQAYQGRMSDALRTVLDASRWIPESRLGAEFFASMDRQVRQIEADAAARPDDPDARMERLRYVMQSGRPDADPILRGIVKDFPNDPDVLLEKARWHLARGETDSALWVLEKAVDVSPDPASSWVLLGEVRKARQENDQALNDYRKAVQKDPRHYQALNAAGRLLQSENRVEEALPFFRRSLAVYEYQPETASGIGDCHVKAGRIDSALVWYEKAAKWAPDRPALLSKWATALGLSGQHSRAAALYETALGLDSLDAGIWYNYGNTIAVLGRLERAAGAFRKSVKLDPGNPDAFNNLGMTCRLLGRMRDARRVFEEGLRLHPRNPLLLKNAAEMESSPIP